MKKTTHSIFSKFMSFAFISMGIFLGVYAFFANATTWTVGSIDWNNANYLSGSFRDQSPTTGDIITALYGSGDDGSVYTQNWSGYNSGSCLNGGMNVVYTGNLSLTGLVENTIYVLTGNISTGNETIAMANCSAVISMYKTGTTFYNSVQLLNNAIFYANGKQHIIFDNISTDGKGDGIGGSHSANGYGIYFSGSSNNSINNGNYYNNIYGLRLNFSSYTMINNSQMYNNNYGLYVTSSSYNIIQNNQVYNNTNGIYLFFASNNIINNVQTYNNYYGLNLYESTYNTINNTQTYSNVHGIYLNSGSNNSISNVQTYNNAHGISLNSGANNTISNTQSYNNINGIYLNSITTGNTYYGTLLFFENTTNISGTTSNLTTGLNTDYPGIFTTGAMTITGSMSRDYLTNPVSSSDIYLFSWTGVVTTFTGTQGHYNSLETNNYSYGSGITTQIQPIMYSGTTLTTGGTFDATKYIGSNVVKLMGNLLSLPTYTNTTGFTVTGISSDTSINNYSVFGNIASFNIGTTINVATGIQLTTGDGTKYIITQLYGDNYFATHFQKNTILDTTTPTFTGTTLSGTSVISGEYYNTGVIITFTDTNLSGATLNSVAYTSGDIITTGGTYIFIVSDLAGNSTGITFTIDMTNPVLTGVTSGTYYSGDVIITGSDNTTFSGFVLSGTTYTGSSLTVTGEGIRTLTGYDILGNTTGVIFTIDKTDPTFTGTTLSGTSVISGEYYNTGITITFDDTNISGATLSGVAYTSGDIITTGGIYIFVVSDLAGNSTGMTFIIDTISPTLTGVISGAYYNDDVVITGSDNTTFSGFVLSGTTYTGSSLTVTGEGIRTLTGYDLAGNTTTGVTFTIDTTPPVTTGTTLGGDYVQGYGHYNTGITITFSDTNISGATLNGFNGNGYTSGNFTNGSTVSGEGRYHLIVYDLAGNTTGLVFNIDTTIPVLTGNYPTSGLNYTGGNNIAFTRSGTETNLSGYTLYINSTGYDMGTATTYTTGLINGSYTRHVVGTDLAGNTGTSQIYPFVISTPFSGSIAMTGTTRIGSLEFTNSTVGIYMRANESVSYSISGGVSNAPVTGTINSQGGRLIHYPVLTGIDGLKDIYVTITNSSGVSISESFLAQLDTVAPAATLVSPASGATVIDSPTFSWAMNSPDPAHISGYQYFVSPTIAFGTIIASGYITGTSVVVSGANLLSNTTGYRYVKSFDGLGNSGVSVIQSFFYSGIAIDTIPDSFSFEDIDDALLSRTYTSEDVIITGMTANTPVLASVSNGALYISGNFVGTTGYIQNGWTVNIELISSDEYEDTVSSTLTINGITDTFSITTEVDDGITDYEDIETDLSNTERLMIIAVFETLKDLYAGDKEVEFFNTFMLVLENKIDEYDTDDAEYESLSYLYALIYVYYDEGFSSNNIDGTRWIVNGIYTAPNGKKYPITYDSSEQRFTSTNFVVPKYFPTLDTLKYIIDINNPVGSLYANSKTIIARFKNATIDGTRQSSPYTAPNRKTFYFFRNIDGRYSSYTFTSERYFDTLDATKEFIYNNNR